MDCMELLTYEDKEIIASRLNDFAYSHKTPENIEPWLQHWADGKNQFLTKIFGNNLIISEHISFVAPKESKEKEAKEIYKLYRANLELIMKDKIYPNWSLEFPIQRSDNYYTFFFNKDNILFNKLKENIVLINKNDGKKKSFPANTKLTRFISKFLLHECNCDILEDIITSISQLHNDSVIEGELCLSIHPMDFMTMSDNTCGWESCMSWEYDGEYRAGTLEMLTSPCVVVAYLKSSKDFTEINWNNKRWRELFIVHPELIMGIKGYPYTCSALETLICNKLKAMVESSHQDCKYYDELITINNPSAIANIELENLENNVTVLIESDLMYNDCYLNNHLGYITRNLPENNNIYINYSGVAYDIEGYEPMPMGFCGSLIHPKHDGYVQCADCEKWVLEETLKTDPFNEDREICEDCWEEQYDVCPECSKTIRKENAIEVNSLWISYHFCPNCFAKKIEGWSEEEKNHILLRPRNAGKNKYKTPFFLTDWEKEISKLRNKETLSSSSEREVY